MTETFPMQTPPKVEYDGNPASARNGRRLLSRVLPRSLRTLHLLFLATLTVTLLAVLADSYYHSLGLRRQLESDTSLQLARAVAGSLEGYSRGILAQELTLGLALTSSPTLPAEQVDRLLRESARRQPGLRRLDWVTPPGVVVASSRPEAVGTTMSGEPAFQALLGGQEWATSDLFSPPSGDDAAFALLRALRDESGVLLGVVVAVVDPALLNRELSLGPAQEGAIALLDGRGRPVQGSSPSDQRGFDGSPPPNPGEPRVLGALVPEVDRRPQAARLVPVPSLGWTVAVFHTRPTVATPALQTLRDSWPFLLAAVLLVATALAMSRTLTVPFGQLRQYALALAQGDLGRQVHLAGPQELKELAEALNQMSAEMKARDQQREDYAHAIAHDLSTPLTVIQGRAQLLERMLAGTDRGERGRQSVEAIITAARRINGLANDLVDSARAESAQLQLNQRPVDLPSFVHDLRARLAGVLDTERLQVRAPEELPRVWADPQRLERILTNLLTNAFKYSPLESQVAVVLEVREAEVVTSVEDHGMGVPQEEMPRLFQRYYRAQQARARREGLGLGLYITRRLIEAHGGRIWVESDPGQRTAFRFTLPLAPPHDPPRSPSAYGPAASEVSRIWSAAAAPPGSPQVAPQPPLCHGKNPRRQP